MGWEIVNWCWESMHMIWVVEKRFSLGVGSSESVEIGAGEEALLGKFWH